MHLYVIPGNWGDAQLVDIQKLLIDTASHLDRLLRNPFDGTIHVKPTLRKDPFIHYRSPTDTQYIIELTARDRKWNKYAYQFAHEFCHALYDYTQLQDNPNKWFHEAICELSSAFTLRRMGERWRSKPPYPNWGSYADKLVDYSQRQQSRLKGELPEGISLHSWISDNEDVLREDEYQREKNAVVAYQLLPIFEESPTGWNAIRKLPTSEGYLKDYLKDWYSLVDEEDKPFVARISDAFGYTIL